MSAGSQDSDSKTHQGGRIPGISPAGEGAAAFMLETDAASSVPVLIAVPHAGRAYPPALLRDLRHPAQVALRLEDRHVDRVAQAVAAATGAGLLVARAPRAMIDLNRAPEDVDWDMFVREGRPANANAGAASRRARTGLGLIPRRLPMLGELWRRPHQPSELAQRLTLIHEPYHAALGAALAQVRERWGAALLIDLHSMPPLPAHEGAPRIEAVVGDRFGASCHGSLVAAAFAQLRSCGRESAHNRPYAGGYVLERHAKPRRGIHAMQIEIDRSTYLDAAMTEPGPGMARWVEDLSALVRRLAVAVSEQGDGAAWPLAAE